MSENRKNATSDNLPHPFDNLMGDPVLAVTHKSLVYHNNVAHRGVGATVQQLGLPMGALM